MIKICPAILTNNTNTFQQQLASYSSLFDQIDIDINVEEDEFMGVVTVQPAAIFEQAKGYKNKFGLHLMTEEPRVIVDEYINSNVKLNCTFYIHQESNIAELIVEDKYKALNFAIVVKAESPLREVEFYNQFNEVQLMTVETGKQGGGFKSEVLNRAEELKQNGFTGLISIDGGVDLETAKQIKQHKIDRVSVGHYFATSSDVQSARVNLDHVLNS